MPGRTLIRSYSASELSMSAGFATASIWYPQLSSGLSSLHGDVAATTVSIVNIAIPKAPRGGQPTQETMTWEQGYDWNAKISTIKVFYLVGTTNLPVAPSVALNKQTYPAATGLVVNAAITQALTFDGVDTVGIAAGSGAAGSHIAVVTPASVVSLADNESLALAITWDSTSLAKTVASSIVDIFGISIVYI